MQRFDPAKRSAAIKPLFALRAYLDTTELEPPLIELVFMRVSQLNGCGYCLDMHSKDARATGETEQRLYLLQVWREAPQFSLRERVALAWTEAVTRLDPVNGVPDDIYQATLAEFGPDGLIDLNMAVILINSWNRIAIPARSEPGSYRPARH